MLVRVRVCVRVLVRVRVCVPVLVRVRVRSRVRVHLLASEYRCVCYGLSSKWRVSTGHHTHAFR